MAEAERIKPRSIFVEEAIQAALESRWADALAVNQTLVERHGADEDTYNRIGKAQTELGHLEEAMAAYSETLQLNPLNVIAQKNAHKLAQLLQARQEVPTTTGAIDVDVFTEEPGKSALTVLAAPEGTVNVAVAPGDIVELVADDGQLTARTSRGVVIGNVDRKIARRLMPLIETGNRYAAAVARVAEGGEIEVMIREEFQSSANAGTPSFPVSRASRAGADFRPYAKDSLLEHRGVDIEPLAGDEPDDPYEAVEEEDEPELEGMQTTEDFDDDAGIVASDDDEDDDDDDDDTSRPEDSY